MKLATSLITVILSIQLSYAGVICQKKNNFSHSLKDPESSLIADYTEAISSLKRVVDGKPVPVKNMSASLFKNLNQTISGIIGKECLKNMNTDDSKLLTLVKNSCFEKCRDNVQLALDIKPGDEATEAASQSVFAAVTICKSSCIGITHAYEQFSDGYEEGKLKSERKEVCTNANAINSTHSIKKLDSDIKNAVTFPGDTQSK